jgi:hypothetical protein
MLGGKKLMWLAAALGLGLGVAGCMGPGRSLDGVRARPAGDSLVRTTDDVPLVPVPRPPLGVPDAPGAPPDPVTPVSARAPTLPVKNTTPSAAPPAPATPSPPTPLARTVTPRQLYQAAQDRYATLNSYIARLRRREQVDGKMKPEEIITFQFRKEPWSVHLKWVGEEGKGREVVYVKGRYDGKLYTVLAAGDSIFFPAGKRMAFLPNNPLVLSASRHPITEAGIGASIDHLRDILAAVERGDSKLGSLKLLTSVKRPEYDRPVHALLHHLPPGFDPSFPKGGERTFFFDPDLAMPMLLVAVDERGNQVEYYHYDRLQAVKQLDDDDFNPDKMGGKSAAPGARAGR